MRGYLSENFSPDRRFWGALNIPAACPDCGAHCNGTVHTWLLLDGPLSFSCWKCGTSWGVAIPLGECPERKKIMGLLNDVDRFYQLRADLVRVIKRLRGTKTK